MVGRVYRRFDASTDGGRGTPGVSHQRRRMAPPSCNPHGLCGIGMGKVGRMRLKFNGCARSFYYRLWVLQVVDSLGFFIRGSSASVGFAVTFHGVDERERCAIGSLLTMLGHLLSRGSRSEERRVGKECRSRGSPYHYKKEEDNM